MAHMGFNFKYNVGIDFMPLYLNTTNKDKEQKILNGDYQHHCTSQCAFISDAVTFTSKFQKNEAILPFLQILSFLPEI